MMEYLNGYIMQEIHNNKYINYRFYIYLYRLSLKYRIITFIQVKYYVMSNTGINFTTSVIIHFVYF